MLERPWSGVDFLTTVNGSAERFPPLRVLFLAHRVAASGLLTMINIYGARGLWIQAGAVGALAGFNDLLATIGVRGEPGEDANAMVSRAITGGQSPDRVLTALGDGVAATLAGFADLKSMDIRFRMDAKPPPQLLPPLDPFPRLLARGLRQLRPPERLRPAFGPRLNLVARLAIPDDAPESRWGLDPTALRVLREAGRGPTLGELLGSGAPSGATWLAVDLLLQLGLIELVAAPQPAVQRPPERPPERPLDRSVDRSTDRAADRSVDRSVSRNLAAPQDRSVDRSVSTRAAVRPTDVKLPDSAVVSGLRQALASMEGADEAAILGIQRSADLTEEKIDRAFRDQSVRFHPDRHQQGTPEQKELAQRCFSRMSDAYAVLRDPGVRADRQARMKAREEGRVYTSESDQKAARIAFARAEIQLRQRRWAEALADLDEAVRLDPSAWRYRLAQAQAASSAGRTSAAEAEAALRAVLNEAPAGAPKAEVHYLLGELLLRDGKEKAGMACFEEALKEQPDHAGAKRRLWLQKRRTEEAPPSVSPGGLLGGLLNRAKKP